MLFHASKEKSVSLDIEYGEAKQYVVKCSRWNGEYWEYIESNFPFGEIDKALDYYNDLVKGEK